jgi:hypothetical protein
VILARCLKKRWMVPFGLSLQLVQIIMSRGDARK